MGTFDHHRDCQSGKLTDLVSSPLVRPLDNAQIAIDRLPQYAQGFLVPGTVVRGDRLRDAVELDEDRALTEATVIHLSGDPAREETAAGLLERRAGQLGICSESFSVVNGTVRRYPIGFGHGIK